MYSDQLNIVEEYCDKKQSAYRIAVMINNIVPLGVNKDQVLGFLHSKNVEMRNTSEAVKEWSKHMGGPWNKGETKHTHASVMSYTMSRTGKNNPIFTLTEEERRQKIYYWCFKSKEELRKIRKQISLTLKRKYATGEILHISKTDPEKFAKIIEALQAGWRYAYENGLIKPQGNKISSYERKIAKALEELNIEFFQQKIVEGRYRYDFFCLTKIH